MAVEQHALHEAVQRRGVQPAVRPERASEHDDGVRRLDPGRLGVAGGEPSDRGCERGDGEEDDRDGAEDAAAEEARPRTPMGGDRYRGQRSSLPFDRVSGAARPVRLTLASRIVTVLPGDILAPGSRDSVDVSSSS